MINVTPSRRRSDGEIKANEAAKTLQTAGQYLLAQSKEPPRGNMDPGMLQISQAIKINYAANLFARAELIKNMGQSFGGARDIYRLCGYSHILSPTMLKGRYVRQDVAKRIVNAFPDATWRCRPVVSENQTPQDTDFEKAWKKLVSDLNLWYEFNMLDRKAGIGRYAVLLLGFDDDQPLNMPCAKGAATTLNYVQSYDEVNAQIIRYEDNPNNTRFGYPIEYNLTLRSGNASQVLKQVHYTRVIHVADDCIDSPIIGTSRLEVVWNRLQDLETIMAGGTEMFWRGGFPGISFEADAQAELPPDLVKKMEQQIDDYTMGLQRYMQLQGVKANPIPAGFTGASAITGMVDVILMCLSGATGIPKRILTGTEEAQLAGEQDENSWQSRVGERRVLFAEPLLLRKFIGRLVELEVLPTPKDIVVNWLEEANLSKAAQAAIGVQKTQMLSSYCMAPGANILLPPYFFFKDIMGYTKEQADAILAEGNARIQQEMDQQQQDVQAQQDYNDQLAKQQAQGGGQANQLPDCPDCNIPMEQQNENTAVCPQCGMTATKNTQGDQSEEGDQTGDESNGGGAGGPPNNMEGAGSTAGQQGTQPPPPPIPSAKPTIMPSPVRSDEVKGKKPGVTEDTEEGETGDEGAKDKPTATDEESPKKKGGKQAPTDDEEEVDVTKADDATWRKKIDDDGRKGADVAGPPNIQMATVVRSPTPMDDSARTGDRMIKGGKAGKDAKPNQKGADGLQGAYSYDTTSDTAAGVKQDDPRVKKLVDKPEMKERYPKANERLKRAMEMVGYWDSKLKALGGVGSGVKGHTTQKYVVHVDRPTGSAPSNRGVEEPSGKKKYIQDLDQAERIQPTIDKIIHKNRGNTDAVLDTVFGKYDIDSYKGMKGTDPSTAEHVIQYIEKWCKDYQEKGPTSEQLGLMDNSGPRRSQAPTVKSKADQKMGKSISSIAHKLAKKK